MILDRKNINIHNDSHLRLVEEEYDVTECLFSTKLSHWMSPYILAYQSLNIISRGYLNIIKYAMIWCHSHMINNTPNINQFQHTNFTT